jgi:plastocyanin
MSQSGPLGGAIRAWIALVLGLVVAVASVGIVLAAEAEAEVAIVQPSDEMAWRYEPTRLTVSAGTTVTWTNQGSASVTVTSADGLFDSGQIAPGGSFSVTFDTPGTFRYFCDPYPHMKGTIVVTR